MKEKIRRLRFKLEGIIEINDTHFEDNMSDEDKIYFDVHRGNTHLKVNKVTLVDQIKDIPKIGQLIVFEGKTYKILGYSSSIDDDGDPLLEIAWDDYRLSPTGYIAVNKKDVVVYGDDNG